MANTFELIASSTVGSGGAANIDFTSIPSTYTDLCILMSVRTALADPTGGVTFTANASTSGYTNRTVFGDGSSAASYFNNTTNKGYVGIVTGSTATANTFGSVLLYCPNYAGSNYKSFSADVVGENNATLAYAMLNAILWSNTAAITSISLTGNGYNFLQYSTAYLYGVKNA
jgi:hypothetical protein